jgi:hypothetical protein
MRHRPRSPSGSRETASPSSTYVASWRGSGLDGERALEYREVRIVLVTDEGSVTTPWGDFTVDSLPPQGLLSVSDDG